MKIVDCFPFYNELGMLEYRLDLLAPHVDYFVLIECTHTFNNNPKPLYFQENRDRFHKYLSKIIHVIVDDPPNNGNPWENDWHQRNSIPRGFRLVNLAPEDVIFLSDCDEIINPRVIQEIRTGQIPISSPRKIHMDMYWYRPQYALDEYWTLPRVFSYGWWSEPKDKPVEYFYFQQIRDSLECEEEPIQDGGWHFSYFGSSKFIANKLKNAAHQELNVPAFTDEDQIDYKLSLRQNFMDPMTSRVVQYIPPEMNRDKLPDYDRLVFISEQEPPSVN